MNAIVFGNMTLVFSAIAMKLKNLRSGEELRQERGKFK
jgi:hypothetical protein